MDWNRKKILILPLDNVLTTDGFRVRRELLDRIRQTNITRVVILKPESSDEYINAQAKAIEFFVFAYCKIAVSTYQMNETLIDDVMGVLPHNQRKREYFLSVGENIQGIDNIGLDSFLL